MGFEMEARRYTVSAAAGTSFSTRPSRKPVSSRISRPPPSASESPGIPRRDISSVTGTGLRDLRRDRLDRATCGSARGGAGRWRPGSPLRRRRPRRGRRAQREEGDPDGARGAHGYSSQSRSFSFFGTYSSVMKLIPRRESASSSNFSPLLTISWISRCQCAFLNQG